MILSKRVRDFFFAILLLLSPSATRAQYPGDGFFKDPSIAIPEGGRGSLEILAFAGSSIFGAARVTLEFDPGQLEVVSVRPGASEELEDGFIVSRDAGEISIVVFNTASLSKPFGTVSLAQIEVQALAPAGTIAEIRTSSWQTLRQDSSNYYSAGAFGAEVAVTAAADQALLSPVQPMSEADQPVTLVTASSHPDLYVRAAALGPPGSTIRLIVLDENNLPHTVGVRTEETGAPPG